MPLKRQLMISQVFLFLFLFLYTKLASSEDVPSLMQAIIIAKMLSYDRNLEKRPQDKALIFTIILDAGTSAKKGDIVGKFNLLADKKIEDHAIRITSIIYKNQQQLSQNLRALKSNILILVAGAQDATLLAVRQNAEQLHIPTFGSNLAQVQQGLAAGVIFEKGKPKMVINLKAAKKQGLDFPATLLQMAKIL
jgi:hypothetical protein